MRTTDLILRQVRHALAAAFLLGGFAALLQLAVPLCALHVIDSAIPSRSLETLVLLALLAGGALATLACLGAVRARILLRAGLWLDHTLGRHLLEDGLAGNAKPEDMAEDAAALARLRAACANGSMLVILDTPWLLLLISAVGLLDWRLAALAGAAGTALVLRAAFAFARLQITEEQTTRAARRTDAWWQSVTRMTGLSRLPGAAAQQWERLNRDHVASAYLLYRQIAGMGDFARFVRLCAQVGTLALGAWLAIKGELTVGALVAAVLLVWRILEPLESLLASLAEVGGVRSAWQRVARRAGHGTARPAERIAPIALPRLHIVGPFAAGLAAALLFFTVGLGVAATTRIGQLVVLTGGSIFETQLAAVYPQRKGLSAHVLVAEGAVVSKGDVLATLDTRRVDARIAALKLQAATAQIELGALNQEVTALAAPGASPLKSRAPLEKLEARIGVLGRQSTDLTAQIAAAEEELAQSRIVAPVSGRVVSLAARPGMPVEVDAPLATLVTADATLLDRLLAPLGVSALPQKLAQLLAASVALAHANEKS